jgi:pimeloyl-ACP methyl ester carboxylesterase
LPEKYVRRNGLPLLVRHTGPTTLPQDSPRWGAGPVVVCLHDAGLQSSVFTDLLGELGRDATPGRAAGGALAFDLPGHGRSGSLDSLPSIEAMAEMARWVSDACRVERPILVGHGMGALIALEWARSRPDSILGLVLCGVGLTLDLDDATIEQMRQVSYGKAPRPFDPSRVAGASGPEGMRRAYMEGLGTDPRATLVDLEASRSWANAFDASKAARGAITCPVRVVNGDSETEDRRRRAGQLAHALANAELVTLADAAHFLPLEQPAALATEIRRLQEAA